MLKNVTLALANYFALIIPNVYILLWNFKPDTTQGLRDASNKATIYMSLLRCHALES